MRWKPIFQNKKAPNLPCQSIHLGDENLRNWRDISVYALDSSNAISRGGFFMKSLEKIKLKYICILVHI